MFFYFSVESVLGEWNGMEWVGGLGRGVGGGVLSVLL